MPITAFILENLSEKNIFVLIEAKDNQIIKFFLYGSRPEIKDDGSACYELAHDNALTIKNKGYKEFEIFNSLGENFDLKTFKQNGELHLILVKMTN